MPNTNIVFIKLYLELFSGDDRFLFQLSDQEQLLFIKFLYLAGLTSNKIPKNLSYIKQTINFRNSLEELALGIKNIQKIFNCVQESDDFYFLTSFEKLHNYIINKNLHGKAKREVPEEEKEEEKEECQISFQDRQILLNTIFDYWNKNIPARAVKFLSDKRKARLRTRFKEKVFVDGWKQAIDKITASDFLSGRIESERKWAASFDWFIENSNNYLKVLEGNYDNRNKSQQSRVRLVL